MPTYEFRCPEGHEFEKFYRSIGAAPPEVACPVCGKIGERLMSAGGGLVFKGSGFYITDYGKDGKKAQTPPAKATGSAGSEASSGSESAAKPDAKPSDVKTPKESKPAESKSSDTSAAPPKKKGSE
jgi:putative FmdB family regulatory protein